MQSENQVGYTPKQELGRIYSSIPSPVAKQSLPLEQKIGNKTFYFGWHKTSDYRDHKGLLLRNMIRRIDLTFRDKTWRIGPILNQQSTPRCVGYSGKGILNAAPDPEYTKAGAKLHPVGYKLTADECYTIAQQNDEWDGENYDGSSGRGLMKGLQKLGIIDEYVSPISMEELIGNICNVSPVLLGSDFSESMCYPDTRGYVYDDGNYVGGHEYFAIGYDKSSKRVTCVNSWGRTWGKNGRFSIHRDALEKLIFGSWGECWTFIKVA